MRVSIRAIVLFRIVAVLFLIFAVLQVTLLIFSSGKETEMKSLSYRNVVPFRKTSRGMFISQTDIRHLFEEDTNQKEENEPVTASPDFIIKGLATTSAGENFAILERKSGEQTLIKEKTKLGALMVESIDTATKEVVLKNDNNKQYTLTLSEDKKNVVSKKTTFPGNLLKRHSEGSWQVSRDTLIEAMSDLNSILRDVRLIPHFKEGKPDGYFLTNIKKGSIIDQIGFENGDVVLRINGRSLSDFSDIVSIYSDVTKSNEIQVKLKRKGTVLIHKYTIKD